jgi:hypothetical protein
MQMIGKMPVTPQVVDINNITRNSSNIQNNLIKKLN